MRFLRENYRYITAVFLLLLVFGLLSLWYPFGGDQGVHAQVGASWLVGKLPYRDVWHTKGFLSFVPHLLVTAVFGHTMWGIRVFDLAWQFGGGLLIFLIGRRRMSQRGALLATGLYYLLYYSFGYWHMAQPEGFLTPVVLMAVWIYDRGRKARQRGLLFFLSGVVIALAPWFKQTAVVFVAALLVWAAYDSWMQRDWRRVGLILGGVILTNGIMIGFTALNGMLGPMLEAFDYAFFDYPSFGQRGLIQIIRLTGLWGIWSPIFIFSFLAGLGYLYFNRKLWPDWLGIVVMALAGLASIYIQGRLWTYHWVSTLPFMVLIGTLVLERSMALLVSLPDKKQQGIVWFFVFACFSLALPILNRHLEYSVNVLSYITGLKSKEAYLNTYDLFDVVETAYYLDEHTEEGEPIFVWGHDAIIYYLADRPDPTRFINDPPLSLQHRRTATFRQEAMQDLAANPPVYIIVVTNDTTGLESKNSKEQLPEFTVLAEFLAARYKFETIIGNFEVYKNVEN